MVKSPDHANCNCVVTLLADFVSGASHLRRECSNSAAASFARRGNTLADVHSRYAADTSPGRHSLDRIVPRASRNNSFTFFFAFRLRNRHLSCSMAKEIRHESSGEERTGICGATSTVPIERHSSLCFPRRDEEAGRSKGTSPSGRLA